MEYIRLKDGLTFTVTEARGFSWKKWDNENKKMLTSDKWEEGFSKKYFIVTDKGGLDLSQSQLGQLLAGVYDKGKCDINGKAFNVRTNGKTGMEVRYYINPAPVPAEEKPYTTEEVTVDDLPY